MTVLTRTLRGISFVVVCCLVASGCKRTSETSSANPDLVWAIGANDAAAGGLAEKIARRWNSQNRGSTVRVHALPPGADDQRQVMATALNAELPNFDILTLDVTQTGEFAENGWLADLEGQRSRVENLSLPAPLQSATWSGRLWAIPFISEAGFLYYRKDLVGDRAPTTWAELQKVGLDVGRRMGIAPFVGQGAQYEGLVVNYLELLAGAGGDLFSREGTEVEYGDGPALRALTFMQDARREGLYAEDFDTMRETEARHRFEDLQAVFMRNWPDAYAQLEESTSKVKGKFGIAPLPTFDGNGTSAIIGGSNLGVSPFSQNPRAATEFVLFASTDFDVQRLLAEDYSRGPALASVYTARDLATNPVMKMLGQVLVDARARPPTPEWSAISDEIQQRIFPAYTGTGDPEPAAEAAVREIREFLELTASTKK